MNAKEFLKSKGIKTDSWTLVEMESINPDIKPKQNINLAQLLNEYHAIASGQKIDVDKKFENLTEKYLKEREKKDNLG